MELIVLLSGSKFAAVTETALPTEVQSSSSIKISNANWELIPLAMTSINKHCINPLCHTNNYTCGGPLCENNFTKYVRFEFQNFGKVAR
jgi:hypothetical protein